MKKKILVYILISLMLGEGFSSANETTHTTINKQSKISSFVNKIKTSTPFLNKMEPKEKIVINTSPNDPNNVLEESTEKTENVKNTEKKAFWKFSKKDSKNKETKEVSDKIVEKMLPTEDSANELQETIVPSKEKEQDNLWAEKQKAIQDANSSLTGEYFEEKKQSDTTDNLVEGAIQKEEPNISETTPQKVEGYVHETVILSLDDCIRKALQNNPQIRSAFSNSEIYKTKIGQAWSNYFPTFNMTNGVTRNRFLTVNFPVPEQVYNFYNAMDLSASQLLFDFGKTKAAADMSKKTYESTIANLDETINTIIYDVKEAYYSLLHALEKQNVYSDSIKSYELQLKQAEAFYSIGTKPKIDVTMAQYNLGNAQLGYIKSSNEVTMATAQLNNAMGLPEEEDYKILDKLVMKEYDYNFEDLLEKAYETRPELLSYRKKAKASEILIRSTKRAFFPNIEAVGAYSVGGGTKFTDDYGWTIGAQFVYGNTNLFLLKKQVDEAKATHQKDLADLDVAEQNVYLQVKQAYINLKNAQESIPITALSLKHAKEQYDLASGRYKAGVGDAIELKDSEVTYRNARLDYLAALLQYNVSVADLERVVGFKLQEKEKIN